ncbi:hypothetical protein JOF53_006514 [Crossiella equi]|uniref:Uncharacterized protein n=1 Tax=Crossiella equi TaxID=130796 RepID=A0ABS5AMM7_9PSEU|nr:hypothetical protein [Crossiella equi]MBP2477642.1 hypothetical protein [Crossiella equi]
MLTTTTAHPAPRRALLIDLDSMVRDDGTWLTQQQLRARLEDVLAQAVPVNHLLAAGRRETVARYIEPISVLHLPVKLAPSVTGGVAEALLERGRHLLDVGYTELFLASGHHQLAPLCQHPGLARSVVCTQEHGLSWQLRTTATEVILLPPQVITA